MTTHAPLATMLAVALLGAPAYAQDIFVFDVATSNGRITLSNGRNTTARQGYDNQPYFTADSKAFLFASQRGRLNDVYEYVLASGEIRQVTDTPDIPEYSPVPDADNRSVTVVRENTVPDQTVWRVAKDTGESEWMLTSREPIGYYAVNDDGYALLWVRYAFAMHLKSPGDGETRFITGNAAPSAPKIIPGSDDFSFVHRQGNGQTWIKRLEPETLAVTPIAPLPGTQIDYAWTPDGTIVAGRDSILFQWKPGESSEWLELASLADDGLRDISRVAVSPDGRKIAIVAADATGY